MLKLLDEASENAKRVSAVVAGVTAVSALIVTITGWNPAYVTLITSVFGVLLFIASLMMDKTINKVSEKIDLVERKFSEETAAIRQLNLEQDLSLKRLELLNLISHTPENKVEIERVAKHYFVTLKGDWYATKVYSKWAEEHGGDISFVISE